MRPVLIVFAHPAFQRSRANRALADAVKDLEGVRFHDLYETYPDFLIDADKEQTLLTEHDAIVFQHPFYWYSMPALLKEWQDLVLEKGWAYGQGGVALRGKTWLHAITAGGHEDSYDPQGYNRFTVAQLLAPLEATAHLCGAHWRTPFVVHSSRLTSDANLKTAANAYRAHILALQRLPGH